MIKEFFISIATSFGISMLIGMIPLIKIMKKNIRNKIPVNMPKINSANMGGFDDIIIELTREKLNQEIQISSAIETKAGILIGTVGVILTIIFTGGIGYFLKIFEEQWITMIPFTIGLAFLIIVFIDCIIILRPRGKIKIFDPRNGNNVLSNTNSINTVKKIIKEQYIGFAEFTEKEREKDSWKLDIGYKLFWIGLLLLSIPIICKAITIYLNK